jgi:hypothetical protein
MPGACALYPFGELMTADVSDAKSTERRRWMTLDVEGCEGVSEVIVGEPGVVWVGKSAGNVFARPRPAPTPSSGDEDVDVRAYRARRQLDERRDEHEWWMDLSTRAACHGDWKTEDGGRFERVASIWYRDWHGMKEWEDVKAWITDQTRAILRIDA